MTGEHDHNDLATVADLANANRRIDLLATALADHMADHPPDPEPPVDPIPPTTTLAAFRVGVVLVQNESTAGYARSKDLPVRGQHYSQFGANSSTPSDAGSLVDKSQAEELYDAIAPQSLDVKGAAYGGQNSRCKDTPEVQKMAQLALDLAATRPFVKRMNFWNELKGYYGGKKPDGTPTPGGWDTDRYCRDYITWASVIKGARPDLKLGGPYSTGQHDQNVVNGMDERVAWIHQQFIDKVVKPHPELVDYIAWDDADGSRFGAYTRFYKDRGITLPHTNTEWYPLPTNAATIALDMACDPLMEQTMFWGGGSDAAEKTVLWSSSGTPTVALKAMQAVNLFTASRPVTKVSAGVYVNVKGQRATVSGGAVTVA